MPRCFCPREIGRAISVRDDNDEKMVVIYLMKQGFSMAEAQVKARTATYKPSIRTFTPPNVATSLGFIFEKYSKLSKACVSKGEAPFFL